MSETTTLTAAQAALAALDAKATTVRTARGALAARGLTQIAFLLPEGIAASFKAYCAENGVSHLDYLKRTVLTVVASLETPETPETPETLEESAA